MSAIVPSSQTVNNPLGLDGSMYIDTVYSLTNDNVSSTSSALSQSIYNISQSIATGTTPSSGSLSYTVVNSSNITYLDNGGLTYDVSCSEEVSDLFNIISLNASLGMNSNTIFGYPDYAPGGNQYIGFGGRDIKNFTSVTGLTPSLYDSRLQTDVTDGVYGVSFQYLFPVATSWSSVTFYLNSAMYSVPVYYPRWLFFLASTDGSTWTQFNSPQYYDYVFPGDPNLYGNPLNQARTYTFSPYSGTYAHYKIVVASAGYSGFMLSSIQWSQNQPKDPANVNNLAIYATSAVTCGVNTQTLNLNPSTLYINGVPRTYTFMLSPTDNSVVTTSDSYTWLAPFAFKLSANSSFLPFWSLNAIDGSNSIALDVLLNGTSIYTTFKPNLFMGSVWKQNGSLSSSLVSVAKTDTLKFIVTNYPGSTATGLKVTIYAS